MILVRKVKLQPTPEQSLALRETFEQHKQCFQHALSVGFQKKLVSGVELHKTTYYDLRKKFPELPSALVCASRVKATEVLKVIKSKTKGKWNTKEPEASRFPTIRYNVTCCGIKPEVVKITTTQGRLPITALSHPLLKDEWHQVITTCELQYKSYKDEWYLVVMVEKEESVQKPQNGKAVLSIDRGCKNVVVLSNNQFVDSKDLRRVKGKYNYLRGKLQSKGTKSSKRLLRKLSGQENRFVKDINHCISKKIVALPFDTFVLEKLEIKREKKLGRKLNTLLNGWSYYQLEQFLTYKAKLAGKRVEYVDARYTSQKCSKCGHIERSNRDGNDFCCKQCGYRLHADLNASRNIRNNYLHAIAGISGDSRVHSITHTSR